VDETVAVIAAEPGLRAKGLFPGHAVSPYSAHEKLKRREGARSGAAVKIAASRCGWKVRAIVCGCEQGLEKSGLKADCPACVIVMNAICL
jgi:hypothetical protein